MMMKYEIQLIRRVSAKTRKTSYKWPIWRERPRTHGTHALIFGGKIIACHTADWQATDGEKLFTNTTRFRCLVYFALFFNFFAQLQWARR